MNEINTTGFLKWRICGGEICGVQICGCEGNPEELNVPETLDGRPVTSLCEGRRRDGFDGVPEHDITRGVFSDCRLLRKVTLPSSISRIPSFAFKDCGLLSEVGFPSGLKEIGDYAFEDCDSMTEWLLPESLETIGDGAFMGSDSVTKVTLHGNLREIGAEAFADCDSLLEIALPESLEFIGKDAFDPEVKLIVVSGSYAENWARDNQYTFESRS